MPEQYLIWCAQIFVPSIIGVLSARRCKSNRALVVAPAISWLVFLVFNLLSERYSPDREIVQGSWPFFQLVIGSFVALVALAVAGFTLKVQRQAP